MAKNDNKAQYYLKPINTPSLSGFLLAIATILCENIQVLRSYLLKDSGILDLDKVELSDEVPTHYPFCRQTYLESIELAKNKSLELEGVESIQKSGTQLERPIFKSSFYYVEKYKSLELSPSDVVEEFLAKIDKDIKQVNGINPLVKLDRQDLKNQAAESSARYKAGEPCGVLDGVLISVKDEINALPYSTSVGTDFIHHSPASDSTIVARLRKQGAIIAGKTKMHEFGLDVTGCNPKSGTPRNAYNQLHWTGGSSSGSGAIVGGGFVPIAIGCDGGGSIRIPAAYNGVYGLKATAGRISGFGCYPLAPTVGVAGPIAGCAADLALAYYLTAGHDISDLTTTMQPPVSVASFSKISLNGIKLGVYWPYFNDATEDIVKACKLTLEKLEALGAVIVDIELQHLNYLRNSHSVTIASEIYAATKSLDHSKMSYPSRLAFALFSNIQASDYLKAAKMRTRGMALWRDVFKNVDAVVTPTTGITAPKIPAVDLSYGISDYTNSGNAMKFIFLANLLGTPAVTCPVGYDSNSLPIGIQYQAKWFNEDLLLQLAHATESVHRDILVAPKGA